MELLVIISSVFRRYHFVLAEPGKPVRINYLPKFSHGLRLSQLDTREGFLRKPVNCLVGIKRRSV